MAAPQRRSLDFQNFDQLIADVARLQAHGYDRVGQWSLEQILDHLTRVMQIALDPTAGPPRPVRMLLRPILWYLLKTRSMPTMPAPKIVRPPAEIDGNVYARFAAITEQAGHLSGDTIDHPAFGRISVTDWQQLQLVHAARHLSFLIPRPT
ncbi:MAG TPA: DUF1569 domain-containing protein [Tepidisphaeraceae bacterium]|jgi:hypothetical protein